MAILVCGRCVDNGQRLVAHIRCQHMHMHICIYATPHVSSRTCGHKIHIRVCAARSHSPVGLAVGQPRVCAQYVRVPPRRLALGAWRGMVHGWCWVRSFKLVLGRQAGSPTAPLPLWHARVLSSAAAVVFIRRACREWRLTFGGRGKNRACMRKKYESSDTSCRRSLSGIPDCMCSDGTGTRSSSRAQGKPGLA